MKLMAAALLTFAIPALAQQSITWRFDNLTRIGNAQVTTIGSPQVIDTPIGKAIHFEGRGNNKPGNPESGNPTGDALLLKAAPLSGDATYTFEVIFRPASQGAPAQRFFHQQDSHSQSRRMFEIRIVNHQWCLDTVGIDIHNGPEQHGVTIACDAAHLHPLDAGIPPPQPTTAKPSAATSTGYCREKSPSPWSRSLQAPRPSAPASTSATSSPATSTPRASPTAFSHPQTS